MEIQTALTAKRPARIGLADMAGTALRILSISAFLFAPYALLAGDGTILQSSPDARSISLWTLLVDLTRSMASNLPLATPFVIVATIAECQIILLRGVGISSRSIHVLLPFAMACVGGYFGFLRFVHQSDLVAPMARLLVSGSALLFFLAGSLHVWSWHRWMSSDPGDSPMLWYAALFCIGGVFFGSCVAVSAPSPYVTDILRYRQQAWGENRPSPQGEFRPIEDSPGF